MADTAEAVQPKQEVVVVQRLNVDAGIELTEEGTALFIDLWQQHPCLWNPSDPQYRDRTAKAFAQQQIADTMGIGWDAVQVNRKINSLKGQYNNEKRRMAGITPGALSGKKRTKWTHFDRMQAIHGQFDVISEHGPPVLPSQSFAPSPTSTVTMLNASQNVMKDAHLVKKAKLSESQSEHHVYAMYVAQRLTQIRSKKTVAKLKRQIDNLINEALEAELSD